VSSGPEREDSNPTTSRRVAIEIPWRTILKLIATAAGVWLAIQLHALLLVFAAAIMLAVALDPLVVRLERFGIARWGATVILALVTIVAVGGFLWATWASLSDQASYATAHVGGVVTRTLSRLPPVIGDALGGSADDIAPAITEYGVSLARSAGYAVTVFLLAFILTMYLLIEGHQTRRWLLAFVPTRYMPRVEKTLSDSQTVIFGYVIGNLITSACATVFMLVVLFALRVPAALLLALMTGVFDVIPVIGSIIPAVPAVLLALTVSPTTALLVIGAHILYNAIENYLIGPWAYGGRLQLSNLAVIVALVVGGELAGVIGALLALPLAAVYPSVERIWLRPVVGEDTIREHRRVGAGAPAS
jgi:predicted PurR-regulated permease PerM